MEFIKKLDHPLMFALSISLIVFGAKPFMLWGAKNLNLAGVSAALES